MKTLAEKCFRLDTKILKKSLKMARDKKPVDGEYLNYLDNGRSSALDYSVEYNFDGNTYLVVSVAAEPQKILLAEHHLSFGVRSYLVCGCGCRVTALYLKFGYLACFRCQRLRYRSTGINTTSEHGRFLQLQAQRLKVMEAREKISRPYHNGRFTKPFLHWLGLCTKVGMFDEVTSSWRALEAIQGKRTQ